MESEEPSDVGHHKHLLPQLSNDDRDQIGVALHATLAELIGLSLLGKQLHWFVVAPCSGPSISFWMR